MTQSSANVVSIGEIENKESYDKDRPVFVTPGIYRAVMVDWKVNYSGYFKKHLLLMHFRIVEMGAFYGEILPGWFNVEASKSRTTVKAGWKSNFLRMFQACFDIRLERKDRIPMSRFDSVIMNVEVVKISKDSRGESLAKINQYSRVKRCIEVLS